MTRVPSGIDDWWRSKLATEKQRLADIEAGIVPDDGGKEARHLYRMIPRLEAMVEEAERTNAHRT